MSTPKNNKIGISLHIGLNKVDPDHYNGWDGKLIACENDARDMQAIAELQGFKTTLLLREEATRKSINNFIVNSSKELHKGDIFLITYSGPGGSVPDFENDKEDGKEETWCLYDSQLIDAELYLHWKGFIEGIRILVISDSCHSKSVFKKLINKTRYTRSKPKNMPDEIALNTYIANKDFYDSISLKKQKQFQLKATVRILSACQDNQYAYDGFLNSRFTEKLKVVWNGGKFNKPYAKFHEAIAEMLEAYQSPGHLVIGKPNPGFSAETPFKI